MELLKQVSPDNWQDVPALRQFVDDLPKNPYCTNSKGFTYIRNKQNAIRHRYIQPNHPSICKWLWFDVDDVDAMYSWSNANLPPPQIVVKNPNNQHAHIGFRVKTPVGIGGRSSIKAMRYLASVQQALAVALGADKSYSGNLIKNPLYVKANAPKQVLPTWINEDEYEENGERDEHETYIVWGAPSSYTLAELADKADLNLLEDEKYIAVNDAGFGRNCSLFETLRQIAYRLPDKSYRAVESYLKSIVDDYNNRFDVPLPYNEVKHIIKSIARYCSRKDFIESHQRFLERQAYRGAKGGKAKGKAYEQQKKLAIELYEKGMKKKDIAERVGVTPRTLTNWGLRKKK